MDIPVRCASCPIVMGFWTIGVVLPVQAAQQDSLDTSRVNACAPLLSPSSMAHQRIFGCDCSLVRRDVYVLWTQRDVAGREDPRVGRPQVVIDQNLPAFPGSDLGGH